MKEPFLILYDNFDSPENEALFLEQLTSNFISKKVRINTYVIINEKDIKARDIYELIKSKLDFRHNFIVVKLDSFFGYLDTGSFGWLKKQIPNWLDL